MHVATRRAVASALAVVALGATLAGCGSSSGGGKSVAALSRTQLDAAANAICLAEEAAGKAVPTPSDITSAQQAATYFDQVDPIISGATAKLDALKPASDVSAAWEAFIAARDTFSSKMHAIREKADAADRSGLTDLQNLSTADLAAAATKVGATSCTEN